MIGLLVVGNTASGCLLQKTSGGGGRGGSSPLTLTNPQTKIILESTVYIERLVGTVVGEHTVSLNSVKQLAVYYIQLLTVLL